MGIAQDAMTIPEVATELSLKEHQVRKRLEKGDLRGEKRGWIWLVDRSSVEKLKKKLNEKN